MRITILGSLATFGLLPGITLGQELSYDWVELRYVDTEIEAASPFGNRDVDGDGFAVAGSLSLTEAFQLIGSYRDLAFDFDVDATAFTIGVGYRYPVARETDLVASLAYVSGEVDTVFGDADDDGFELSAGLRSFVHDRVEVEGGVAYVDLDESGDDTSIFGTGRYWFNDEFAVGAGLAFGNDATTLTVSGRYSFGANLGRRPR
ncbi:hypothetical protein BH24PSE2_BH24PSE2_09270 [soil metagenome]